MVVSRLVEACFEELVREHAVLGKAINAAPNFEVDPAVAGLLEEVVFLCEFVGDVSEFDLNVLRVVKWGVEVEFADVKGGELGARKREDAVEDEFGEFKGSSWGSDIARKANAITADGDTRAVGIGFSGQTILV